MYITNREIGAISYAAEQLRHIIESADDKEAEKDVIQVQNLLYRIIEKWKDEKYTQRINRYVHSLMKKGLSHEEILMKIRDKYGLKVENK